MFRPETEGIKYIFGLKVRELRQTKGLSFQDLSASSGLSISYLNEIEKGKKYPKGDKIWTLARALGVEYDDLVSLKVSKKLLPLVELLNAKFFQEFPLEHYGLDPQKVIELIADQPEKVNAFISTIQRIARSYEMQQEHFYHTALRAYQEINDNYFPDIEESVLLFAQENALHLPISVEKLEFLLEEKWGISVDRDALSLHPALGHLRSLFLPKEKKLLIHRNVSNAQTLFLLAREIGFQVLNPAERPLDTPPQHANTFDFQLQNYRASYFSVALLMPRTDIIAEIRAFTSQNTWNEAFVLDLLEKYEATPEMLMQRFTQILPSAFNLNTLFFLRFSGEKQTYHLTKELHLSHLHNPHANLLNEHYCRRWLSIRAIQRLLALPKSHTVIADIQRSQYLDSPNEYLCITLAFRNITNPEEGISVTIGFKAGDTLRQNLGMIDDPLIEKKLVHTTCERCPILDCQERVAPPEVIERQEKQRAIDQAIATLLD